MKVFRAIVSILSILLTVSAHAQTVLDATEAKVALSNFVTGSGNGDIRVFKPKLGIKKN